LAISPLPLVRVLVRSLAPAWLWPIRPRAAGAAWFDPFFEAVLDPLLEPRLESSLEPFREPARPSSGPVPALVPESFRDAVFRAFFTITSPLRTVNVWILIGSR
jgi:hypothetical protein